MARLCSVCIHAQLPTINKRLLAGDTLAMIEAAYGLKKSAISRHRADCLGAGRNRNKPINSAMQNRLAVLEAALPSKEEIAGGFAAIRSQLDEIVDTAKAGGQLSVSVQALDALRRNWSDVARLAGHGKPQEIVVNSSTNVGIQVSGIVDRLMASVADLPETRERLARVLLDAETADAASSPGLICGVGTRR